MLRNLGNQRHVIPSPWVDYAVFGFPDASCVGDADRQAVMDAMNGIIAVNWKATEPHWTTASSPFESKYSLILVCDRSGLVAFSVYRVLKLAGHLAVYRSGTEVLPVHQGRGLYGFFTSEILKRIINTEIMAQGYVPSHTIAASGEQCVDPHNQGSGPIRANTSIIMDIFPRSQKTGYFGDITRTVVRGRASDRLKHAYHCVAQAQEIGFSKIKDGASAYDIHQEIVNYFASEGFPTGLQNGRMQGFFHGTGHGLGLDIHEAPSFGQRSKNALRAGNVVTVEPGLYYEEMGGVRLEDVVVVRKTSCNNLVKIPKILEV